jgi:xylulokinase
MRHARLLGLDIGTTGVRAALYDADGTLLGDASVRCAFDSPSPGFAEIDAERWWRATQRVLSELAMSSILASLSEVSAIAVVGQAPTLALVDETGNALGPAILWLDTRASAEAKALGQHPYYLGPKLRWLAQSPGRDSLRRARWLLQAHAYIAYKLTGKAAVDPSTAALCSPLFELESRRWEHKDLSSFGLRTEQLPPVRRAEEILGEVISAAARTIGHGLPPGTPVVVGGGDFAAAALGSGVIDEGEACLMLGTAGNLLLPRRSPGTDDRLINAHHVGVDRWLSLGGTLSGGAHEWLRNAISRPLGAPSTAVRHSLPSFDLLDDEAATLSPGSDGLVFLPYLQGERTPIWDAEARGAYVGLHLQHGRGHLWRAMLEGVALSFASCQRVLEEDGIRLRDVIATDGGGKSPLFRQILCDALGIPLGYAPMSGGTVAGAAILAGLGTGAIRASEDARRWRGALVMHEPTPSAHARYRELLELRQASYEGLKPVFTRLASVG